MSQTSTSNYFIYCHACKIQIDPKDDEGDFHIIPEHDGASGHDPETGECINCPVPAQCGPLSYYAQKSIHDELLEAARLALKELDPWEVPQATIEKLTNAIAKAEVK